MFLWNVTNSNHSCTLWHSEIGPQGVTVKASNQSSVPNELNAKDVKSFDFTLLNIFFPWSRNVVYNCATIRGCLHIGHTKFHVLGSLKDENQHSAKQFVSYTTASHFHPHFRIAEIIKVTCKPSLLSRSFPSCLFGKQEDTVRQRTKVARTLINRTSVMALHSHHFKRTCINISCSLLI